MSRQLQLCRRIRVQKIPASVCHRCFTTEKKEEESQAEKLKRLSTFYTTQAAQTIQGPKLDPNTPTVESSWWKRIKTRFRIGEPYIPPTFDEENTPKWTKTANYLLEYHTTSFSFIYFGLRGVTLIGIAGVFHSASLFQGMEWVAGWVFARFTAKWRQPANFALAWPVRKMFPKLELVRFSKIFQYRPEITHIVDDAYVAEYAHMIRKSQRAKKKKRNQREDLQLAESEVYPDSLDRAELQSRVQQGFNLSWKRKLESWELLEGRRIPERELKFRKALHAEEERKTFRRMELLDWFNNVWAGPIDKYGMSWYVGSKISSVGTVVGAVFAFRYGMDVIGYLDSQPGNQTPDLEVGFTGPMAGAWIFNTCFIPIHFRAANKLTALWRGEKEFDPHEEVVEEVPSHQKTWKKY